MSAPSNPANNKTTFFNLDFDKIPRLLRNRYFLIAFLFFIWIMFLDRSNVIEQWQLDRTVRDLQDKKSYFEREIGQVKRDKKDLFSNYETLEKFARERYHMKKANEDVFIIIEEE